MNMKGSEMKIKGLERKHDENEMSKNRTHNNASLRLGNNSGRGCGEAPAPLEQQGKMKLHNLDTQRGRKTWKHKILS